MVMLNDGQAVTSDYGVCLMVWKSANQDAAVEVINDSLETMSRESFKSFNHEWVGHFNVFMNHKFWVWHSLTNLNMFQFEYKCSLSSTATAYKVNPGWHTMAGTGSGFWQVRDIGFWSFEIYAVDMKSHQVLFSWHEISETWLTMTWLTRPAG